MQHSAIQCNTMQQNATQCEAFKGIVKHKAWSIAMKLTCNALSIASSSVISRSTTTVTSFPAFFNVITASLWFISDTSISLTYNSRHSYIDLIQPLNTFDYFLTSHSSIKQPTHSFTRWFILSFNQSINQSNNQSNNQSLNQSLTYSLTHSLTHSLTNSFTHYLQIY